MSKKDKEERQRSSEQEVQGKETDRVSKRDMRERQRMSEYLEAGCKRCMGKAEIE